ncbi:SAM-dependent methyltransferase [Streptomyces sp. A7024]|uniref:SAM-dependent methyltransferase n=1 Tax=Streptomyces coryli TaxID=1128680 RepID=A0A6G4U2N5_9ACTN|nr:SAM-dependent methyltransferase [Streptomyces coryli]NGN65547.1 SAM-dependent methyltransferase [Streptomyces coryli]
MTDRPDDTGHVDLRVDVPHSARVYDYLLGGKDNYAADRAAGDASAAAWPSLPTSMKQTRIFMHRVTRTLAAQYGMRQFLDIGTGIPTPPNLHEVAQEVAPESRVVYVDNDPIVLAHARALLQSSPEGRTGYIQADMRDPEAILNDPKLHKVLDLKQPVVLSVIAVVHFILDKDDPQGLVARLLRELAPGSFLALTVFTGDTDPERVAGVGREYNERGIPLQIRDRAEAERFFAGLELIEPGVSLVHHWRPDGMSEQVPDSHIAMYGGVARKNA